ITFDLGGGSFTLESNSFALGLNSAPSLTAAGSATVDANFTVSFDDNSDWESKISEVSYNSTVLSSGTDYDIDGTANTITLKPGGGNSALQTAGTANLVVKSDTYADATVS
ncbi:hemoblobin-interacting domain-containing protein, partial [Marinifilum sp. D714]|uniref:hemoblobin-interacting domain-containing protein n=1 Tax=Marinifilum sp. D714 TaxID=2937523 RepID=UPI0027C7F681